MEKGGDRQDNRRGASEIACGGEGGRQRGGGKECTDAYSSIFTVCGGGEGDAVVILTVRPRYLH